MPEDEPLSAYLRRCKGQPHESWEWIADRVQELEDLAKRLPEVARLFEDSK